MRTLQTARATLSNTRSSTRETDWPQIVRLYALLGRVQPSRVVFLNQAAVVTVDGSRPLSPAARRSERRFLGRQLAEVQQPDA
jgi:predicted RNA polymerase sigma factor